MEKCDKCQTEMHEEAIPTDYFQVHGDQGKLIHVCGDCYLALAKQFVEEEHDHCQCGAKLVFAYGDDYEEIIGMGRMEWILPLICSEAKKLIDAGAEREDLEEEHEVDYMLYTYNVPDDAMNWE